MTSTAYAKDLFFLTKPKIALLVVITGYAGMVLELGGTPDHALAFVAMLGLALASCSSSILNNYVDRDVDVLMERTCRRALPTKRVNPNHALWTGVVLGTASVILLMQYVNLLTAMISLATICFYSVVYTVYLKRTTMHCTVIGGIAGAAPPIIGSAAATGQIGVISLVLFAIMFVWQPPHFWALAMMRADEYKKAGLPMLPVVVGPAKTKFQILLYTIILLPVSLLPTFLGATGMTYLVVAILLNAIYLWKTIEFVRGDFSRERARKLFLFSIFYLTVLFIFLFADVV